MRSFVPGGLAAICLCLAGAAACQLIAPVAEPGAQPAGRVAVKIAVLEPSSTFSPPSQSEFAIISARALFDPARKPVVEPEQTGAPNAAVSDLSLVGVAVGATGSVALLKTPDGIAAAALRVGQSVRGWTLEQVGRDFVVLREGASRLTIRLRSAKGVPQPALSDVQAPDVTGQPGR